MTAESMFGYVKFSLAFLFVALVFIYSYTTYLNIPNNIFLILGAVFGAYMAMNIGANDIAVIIASQLGLPVSSTHIAVGSVFGVGFLREYLDSSESNYIAKARKRFKKDLENFERELAHLVEIKDKNKANYQRIFVLHKLIDEKIETSAEAKKNFQEAKSIKYVKRDAVKRIIATWLITVPVAVFFMIKGIMS